MGNNGPKFVNAAAWFQYAAEDIKAARALHDADIYPMACFHAQQAVEKAFKGLLSLSRDIEKTHSVVKLSKVAKGLNYGDEDSLPKISKLDAYYMVSRYPDMLPLGTTAVEIYDAQDSSEAISTAEQAVLTLAQWASDAGVDIDDRFIVVVKNQKPNGDRIK